MKFLSFFSFCICMVLALGRASATTYYVESTGNDSHSGLEGAPWRTLGKAFQSVAPNQGDVIQVGPGTFTETAILTLKSGVSLIGAGSGKTKILVNHSFSLTDAVPNANPHVDTFPEHFILQLDGTHHTLKGFSLDGQEKRCHGGIFAARTSQVVFEDLEVTNFRYCGLWVIDAHDTTLRFSNFKNNTYGNPNRGDSGAVQYHRGKNLTIHDNRIEETGNLGPDMGGYAMKAQDRRHSVSLSNVLEGFKMYNNVLIVPSNGAWEKGIAPAFAAEFLGMALKDCEIHNNLLNGTLSLAGPALSGEGIRIHHNFFNIGRGRYGYGVEGNVSNIEIDHNYFFGGLHPIAVFGRDPKNHNIHHNIFEAACADKFANRDLLRYRVPVAGLRFINNTIIDNGSIGQIFGLHPSTTYEIRNNLIFRPGEPKDIWGPEIPGKISHNFLVNVTPRGENAMTGDPGITLAEGSPLQAPFYTVAADSPLRNKGEIVSPLTDGFSGVAPSIGALDDGKPAHHFGPKPSSSQTASLLLAFQARGEKAQTGVWGDQGDGTFRNPILAGDYSDPDPIRVGNDFYMASSTFACSPGVTILHSRDLVNWETIGAAFTDLSLLSPEFNWDRMNRYSKGIYAPSMRYHDGKFWIFVNSLNEGFYCCTAVNPAGLWKVTRILDKNRKPLQTYGWTDPCPFWDDDGKAYLASSRPGKQWFGYLFEMTPDGTQLLDADSQKMNASDVTYAYPEGGTLFSPFHSTEGNKIYKRNGYYYLIHIEFTNGGNGMGTYVLRSKHIYGTRADGSPGKPGDVGTYELFKFGPVGPRDSDQKIPGQGGLVDTPDGQWFWMAQFNHSGSDGRRPTLTPVTWIEDWPVPGVNIKDKQGDFAWQLPKPIQGSTVKFPFSSDDFDKPALNPCWLWNHQPRADKWSLTERPGFLRLHAFKPAGLKDPDEPVKFFRVANVINQRHFRSELTRATFKLDLSGMADGQEAGIAHFNGGQNNASLGVSQKGELKILKYEENGKLTPGPELPKGATMIWMRSTVKMDDRNVYEYSLDGETFLPFGGTYRLSTAGWRGDMIGTYTFNSLGEAGYVDVDSFQYEVHNAPAAKTQ